MKRFISTILLLCCIATPFFADEPGDEYDDGYVYESNGSGDQFLKFSFSGEYPLSFFLKDEKTGKLNNQLRLGASFDLGYYRFLSKTFAVGGEVTFCSNWSIDDNLLITLPITPGILFQPTVGNFEFPLYLNVGIGFESWVNEKYFPSFAAKGSAGCFYRFTESWSAGVNVCGLFVPQFYRKKPECNHMGYFAIISLGGRFHF